MKKICIALFMAAALMVSLSTYAQDNKADCPKAKTEQAEKGKACCAKKDKACCEKKDKACCAKKDKACCTPKDKSAKPSAGSATVETKSCGKKG